MDRAEFEVLRDMRGKKIVKDIVFTLKRPTRPLMIADDLRIENTEGVDLRLVIQFNPETTGVAITAHVPGVGSICRLDVRGTVHRPAGRSHKHSLHTPACPDNNLSLEVQDRSDLQDTTSVRAVFDDFCVRANIEYEGTFHEPEAQP